MVVGLALRRQLRVEVLLLLTVVILVALRRRLQARNEFVPGVVVVSMRSVAKHEVVMMLRHLMLL
jgi:hypothetical protein